MDEHEVRRFFRPRKPDSRKGDNGRLLVVGGSMKYYGAPTLVSLGAMRAGADLVYALVPDRIAPTVASHSPDLIVWAYHGETLNSRISGLLEELNPRSDTMVIGNGLTRDPHVIEAAQHVIDSWKKPLVIDADPIGRVKAPEGAIYTPHYGEFLRLADREPPRAISERGEAVKKEAKRLNSVMLLKGSVDIVSDGERTYFNRTGNSAMTCGGTGDVLAGIIGAFVSQGHKAFEATCLGAYINGLAGDIAYKNLGFSMRATDVISSISQALISINR